MCGTTSGVEVPRPTVDEVFTRAYVQLCRLALVILGDELDAEEIVMEAFERTMPHWESIDVGQPEAYLRRSVVNLCRNRIRRTGLWRRTLPRLAGERPKVRPVDDVDRAAAVWAAVGRLPAGQRLCVALFYYDDLPQEEIARLLDCSVGTVKSQLSKARSTLALALEGEDVP